MEIDDDFVSAVSLIEEGKYIIVVSFCPRVIWAMTEDKLFPFFSRISGSRIFYDTIFEFFFINILCHSSWVIGFTMLDIDEGIFFTDFRYDDAVFVGRYVDWETHMRDILIK